MSEVCEMRNTCAWNTNHMAYFAIFSEIERAYERRMVCFLAHFSLSNSSKCDLTGYRLSLSLSHLQTHKNTSNSSFGVRECCNFVSMCLNVKIENLSIMYTFVSLLLVIGFQILCLRLFSMRNSINNIEFNRIHIDRVVNDRAKRE